MAILKGLGGASAVGTTTPPATPTGTTTYTGTRAATPESLDPLGNVNGSGPTNTTDVNTARNVAAPVTPPVTQTPAATTTTPAAAAPIKDPMQALGGANGGQGPTNTTNVDTARLPNTNPTGTPSAGAVNNGLNTYGPQGNMTLQQFQNWQADTFNKNNAAAAAAWNPAMGPNPYTQYVNNPETPGKPSAVDNTPANQAAWLNSGLASQLSPSAYAATGLGGAVPGSPALGNTGITPGTTAGTYTPTSGDLNNLSQILNLYGGLGGQNIFGNGFSPLLAGGSSAYNNLSGLGNLLSNGTSSTNGTDSTYNGFLQLLPFLLSMYRNQPSQGAYGNLGL